MPHARQRLPATGSTLSFHSMPPTGRGRNGVVIVTLAELISGKEAAAKIGHAEAFEITEYGSRPNATELKRLFPFFDK